MTTPRTFGCEHGDPGRRSRTDARPRRYVAFEAIVLPAEQVERWPVRPRDPARYVVVDPSGQRMVIVCDTAAVVLQPYAVRLHLAPEIGRWAACATERGLLYGPHLHPWDGEPPQRLATMALLLDDEPRTQAAVSLRDDRWLCAVSSTPAWSEAEVRIESRQLDQQGVSTQWRAHLPGQGIGAIDDAGSLAVLTSSGLHVYAASPPERRAAPQWSAPVSGRGHAVSAAAPGWVVLAPSESSPNATIVRAWNRDGTDAWETTVPFAVQQPPVQRPDGSLVLAGSGLAGLHDGTLKWQQPRERRVTATAYGDGSLAVAEGPWLHILGPDQRCVQSLQVPHGESIVTQPTIAPDGTIYVGTASRVYAVR